MPLGLRARSATCPSAPVLLVVPDPIARSVYAEVFRRRGHFVLECADPRRAERLVVRRRIGAAVIAVPRGALALAARLRARRPALQVLLTGVATPATVDAEPTLLSVH